MASVRYRPETNTRSNAISCTAVRHATDGRRRPFAHEMQALNLKQGLPMRSILHTVAAAALAAGLAFGIPAAAQMGTGSGSGAYGSSPMPGGAPGVQRNPLNADPGATGGDGRAPAPSGISGDARYNGGGGEGGGVGTTLSDDEIHQACMMKANPDECRSRMRRGETDPSVERNPP